VKAALRELRSENTRKTRRAPSGDVLELRTHPDESGKLVDGSGRAWTVTDPALVADEGPGRLERLPGHLAYWFGWYAFFPDTGLWPGER